MKLLNKCRSCGAFVTPFSGSECEACSEKASRQKADAIKQEEEAKQLDEIEQEHKRMAKAERLICELNSPIAKLLAQYIDESVQVNLTKANSSDTATLVGVTELFFQQLSF